MSCILETDFFQCCHFCYGDLTVRLSAKNKDELNDLAVSFNAFIKNVQEIVSEVKEAAGEVASGNNQLSATMEEKVMMFYPEYQAH